MAASIDELGTFGEFVFESNRVLGAWKAQPGDASPMPLRLGWSPGPGLVSGSTKVVEVNFRGCDCFRKVSSASRSPAETKFQDMYGLSPSIPRLGKFGKGVLSVLRGAVPVDDEGRPKHLCPKCWDFMPDIIACGYTGTLVIELLGRQGADICVDFLGVSLVDRKFREILSKGESFYTLVSYLESGNQVSDLVEAIQGVPWNLKDIMSKPLYPLPNKPGYTIRRPATMNAFSHKMVVLTNRQSSVASFYLDCYKSLVLTFDCATSNECPPHVSELVAGLFKSPPDVGKLFMHGPRAAKVMPGHGPRSVICCLRTAVILAVAQLIRLPHMCVLLDTPDICSARPASYFRGLQPSAFFARYVSVFVPSDSNVAGFDDVASGCLPGDVLADVLTQLGPHDCVEVGGHGRIPIVALAVQKKFDELQKLAASVGRDGAIDNHLITLVEARAAAAVQDGANADSMAKAKLPQWIVHDLLGIFLLKTFVDENMSACDSQTAHLRMNALNPALIRFVKIMIEGYAVVFEEHLGKGTVEAVREALVVVLGRLYVSGTWLGPSLRGQDLNRLSDCPALAYPSHPQAPPAGTSTLHPTVPPACACLSREVLLSFAKCFVSDDSLPAFATIPAHSLAATASPIVAPARAFSGNVPGEIAAGLAGNGGGLISASPISKRRGNLRERPESGKTGIVEDSISEHASKKAKHGAGAMQVLTPNPPFLASRPLPGLSASALAGSSSHLSTSASGAMTQLASLVESIPAAESFPAAEEQDDDDVVHDDTTVSDIMEGLFPDLAAVPDPITLDRGPGSVPEHQQPPPRQQSRLASVPRGRLVVRSPIDTLFGADQLPLSIALPLPDPLDADSVSATVAASALQLQQPRRLPLPLPPPPPLPLGADSSSEPVATSAFQQQLPRRLPLPIPSSAPLPRGADSASAPVDNSALPERLPRRPPLPLSPPPLIPSAPARNVSLRIPLKAVSKVILRLPLKAPSRLVPPPSPTLSLPSGTAGPSNPLVLPSGTVPRPLPLILPHGAVPQPPPVDDPPLPSFPAPGDRAFAIRSKPRPAGHDMNEDEAVEKFVSGEVGRWASIEEDVDPCVAQIGIETAAGVTAMKCLALFRFNPRVESLAYAEREQRERSGGEAPTHFPDMSVYLAFRAGHMISEIFTLFRRNWELLDESFRRNRRSPSSRDWFVRGGERCMNLMSVVRLELETRIPNMPASDEKVLVRIVLKREGVSLCSRKGLGVSEKPECWCLSHVREGDYVCLHFLGQALGCGIGYVKEGNGITGRRKICSLVVYTALCRGFVEHLHSERMRHDRACLEVSVTHMVAGSDFSESLGVLRTLKTLSEVSGPRNLVKCFVQTPDSRHAMKQDVSSLLQENDVGSSAVEKMKKYLDEAVDCDALKISGKQQKAPILLACAAVAHNITHMQSMSLRIRIVGIGPPGSGKSNVPLGIVATVNRFYDAKVRESFRPIPSEPPMCVAICPTNKAAAVLVGRFSQTSFGTVCSLWTDGGHGNMDDLDEAILKAYTPKVIASANEEDLSEAWRNLGDALWNSDSAVRFKKLRDSRVISMERIKEAKDDLDDAKANKQCYLEKFEAPRVPKQSTLDKKDAKIAARERDVAACEMKLRRTVSSLEALIPSVAAVLIGTPHAFRYKRNLPPRFKREASVAIFDECGKLEEPKMEWILSCGLLSDATVEVMLGDPKQLDPYVDKFTTALRKYETRGVMARSLARVPAAHSEISQSLEGAACAILLPIVYRSPLRSMLATSYSAYGGALISGHLENSLATLSPLQNTIFGCLTLIDTAGDPACTHLKEFGGTSSLNFGVADLAISILVNFVASFPELCLKSLCPPDVKTAKFLIASSHGAHTRQVKDDLSKIDALKDVCIGFGNFDAIQGSSYDVVLVLLAKSGRPKDGENVEFSSSNSRSNVATSRSEKVQIVIGDFDYYGNIKSIFWNSYVAQCKGRFSYLPSTALSFLKNIAVDFETRL